MFNLVGDLRIIQNVCGESQRRICFYTGLYQCCIVIRRRKLCPNSDVSFNLFFQCTLTVTTILPFLISNDKNWAFKLPSDLTLRSGYLTS